VPREEERMRGIGVALIVGSGYVSPTTTAQTAPTTSTINFPVGDVRANQVIMPKATYPNNFQIFATYMSGSSSATTDLVFDLTGYFVPF
jgi:hypothetical protein